MKGIASMFRVFRRTTLLQWGQVLVGAWLWFAAGIAAFHKEDFAALPFAQDLSLWSVLLPACAVTLLLMSACAVWSWWKLPPRVAVSGVCALCLSLAVRAQGEQGLYLFLALTAVLGVAMFYAAKNDLFSHPRLRRVRGVSMFACGGIFLAMTAVLSLLGCLRHATYVTPNFDFGIFCQMFHNMKETGLPLTTCERNGLLSHFAVHISPIYYLLLPAYALFPSPYTLAVGQAVVVASGVFPLFLIAKKKGLSDTACTVLALLYAAYPALSTGCLYDIHENCFLAPLLLWLFCAYEHKKGALTLLAAVAVLAVKEDAAVFVLVFGLYVLVAHRDVRIGVPLMGMALLWFGTALWLLGAFGEGGMVGRYADYQYNGGGLLSMVKTLLVNPGLFLNKVFYGTAEAPFGKLWYLVHMVLPLASLLFCGKRFSRYILLLPVVVNLLSNWPYQYDFTFQYSFGAAVFFLYVCVLNAADYAPPARRAAIGWAALASVMLYAMVFWPTVEGVVKNYETNRETYRRLDAVIAQVPKDASVTCSTFLLPHLADREVLYEDFYHPETDTDYVVLDLRPGYLSNNYDENLSRYAAAGYTAVVSEDSVAVILKSPDA